MMTICDALCEPLILCLLILLLEYIYMHYKGKPLSKSNVYLLLMLPVMHATALWMLYYIIGLDNVVDLMRNYDEVLANHPDAHIFYAIDQKYNTPINILFYYVDVVLISIYCGALSLVILVMSIISLKNHHYRFGDFFRFWFKRQATNSHRAASFLVITLLITEAPIVVLGRTFVMHTPALSISISVMLCVIVYLITHIEKQSALAECTRQSLLNVENNVAEAEPEEPKSVEIGVPAPNVAFDKDSKFEEMLRHLIEEEHIYLKRDLHIDDIADRLGTNRNKVSVIVQKTYRMTFRELVNHCRIEASQSYMTSNPAATNEEVAWECGFTDPSTFFRRFKEATGMSPRLWLNSQTAQQ